MNGMMRIILLGLCLAFISSASVSGAEAYWWQNYPIFVGDEDSSFTAKDADRLHARMVMGNYEMDPAAGPFFQRMSAIELGLPYREVKQLGMHYITWMETFGSCFVTAAGFTQNPDGSFLGQSSDTNLMRLRWMQGGSGDESNAWVSRMQRSAWFWNSDGTDGGNVVRWLGLHNAVNDEDFARPLFTTKALGFPVPTYPDGRKAVGYIPNQQYPFSARVYEAVCAKDINGDVVADLDQLVENDPVTGQPKTPVDGLYSRVLDQTDMLSLSGHKVGEKLYARMLNFHKDSAAPFWTDYAKVMVRSPLKHGVDGLWCDNYSPFDSFGMPPIFNGFGAWSEYRFKIFLAKRFTKSQLASMGVSDPATFSVRDYLKRKAAEFGAKDPGNILDPKWCQDNRWLDDPIWCAYKVSKQQSGQQALKNFYTAIKAEARKAGRPDFLIAGNDSPAFSHGWVRDDYLDMVSTETTPGWHTATGSRGITIPPLGKNAVIYRAGLEFQKGPYQTVWYYLNGAYAKYQGKPELAKVLMAEAFANSTFFKYRTSTDFPGTDESVTWWNSFLVNAEKQFGRRTMIADVGIVYSPDNQLAFCVPGGHAMNHDYQPHPFAHWGFATAMIDAHIPYRVVTDWKLKSQIIDSLKVLILPNVECLDNGSLPVLEKWVRSGGRLVMTGPVGLRYGVEGCFARRKTGLLNSLIGQDVSVSPGISEAGYSARTYTIVSNATDVRSFGSDSTAGNAGAPSITIGDKCRVFEKRLGKGMIIWTPDSIDIAYYLTERQRPLLLKQMTELVGRSSFLDARDVASTVGIFCWKSAAGSTLFADLVNYNIDPELDKVTPAKDIVFKMKAPLGATDVHVTTLTPDNTTPATAVISDGWVRVTLPELNHFAGAKMEFSTK